MFLRGGKNFNIKDTGNARDVALFAFLEITENSRKSNTILKELFEENDKHKWGLDRTDRAFIKRLVTGTLSRIVSIDSVLEKHLSRPLKRQKPLIKGILRISAYQIFYMDRVPDSAVCNEAVKLVKLHGMDGLSGLVNAVLRTIVRKKDSGEDLIAELSEPWERYSVPAWMHKLIVSEYPDKAEQIFEALLEERHDTVRFNLSKAGNLASDSAAAERSICESLKEDGFVIEKTDLQAIIDGSRASLPKGSLPVVYELCEGGDITESRAFKNGWITVQDPSSALVAAYAAPGENDHIIDVCAAPGGKTLAVADILELKGGGHIEARDVSIQKVRLIEDNIKRCGFKNISTRVLDALEHDEESLYRADIIIADLPCSGMGVMAKKPDIKLNLKPYSVEELKHLQRDILMNVSRFLKPKGRLVYSTCTISREENEMNANWAAEELGFKLISSDQILPGRDHDGFYIAVMEKKY